MQPAPTVCDGEINLCVALDHSGSVCSHTLLTGEIDGPGTGAEPCNDCGGCQDTCRNGSYGIFDPCPFSSTTGFDQNTCCVLFSRVLEVARGVVNEVSQYGRPSEFSVVGFGTTAFYQYPDGTQSNPFGSYTGPMLNLTAALATIENSDYKGGFTNHDQAIRWW